MTIESNIQRDAYGNITIQMQGDLSYEYSIPLREQIQSLFRDYPQSKITLDMAGMDFVGSSGISHFVETIKIMCRKDKERVGLSNVNDEFQKVFKLYELNEVEEIMIDFDMESNETASMNTLFGNRKRTFEN